MKRLGLGYSRPLKTVLINEQDGKCFFCGEPLTIPTATIDHLLPRWYGGSCVVVVACRPCNGAKADRLPTMAELVRFRDMITSAELFFAGDWYATAIAEVEHNIKRFKEVGRT